MMLPLSRPNPKCQGTQAWALMILRAGFEQGFSINCGFPAVCSGECFSSCHAVVTEEVEPIASSKIRFSGHRLEFSEKKKVTWFGGFFPFFHKVI